MQTLSGLRHLPFSWPAAWFLTGVGLVISDVFSQPRTGPLWVVLLLGAVGWGLAGGAPPRRDAGPWRWQFGLVWALIFVGSLLAALSLMVSAEAVGGAGIEGLLVSFALGGVVGGLLTARYRFESGLARALAAIFLWGALFLAGSCVGVVGSYLLADLFEGLVGSLIGAHAGLSVGFGLGWAIGGLLPGLAWRTLAAPAPD